MRRPYRYLVARSSRTPASLRLSAGSTWALFCFKKGPRCPQKPIQFFPHVQSVFREALGHGSEASCEGLFFLVPSEIRTGESRILWEKVRVQILEIGVLRYQFFNTNNLWVDLSALKDAPLGNDTLDVIGSYGQPKWRLSLWSPFQPT